MKIISWNIRQAGPCLKNKLNDLIKFHNSNILLLMETKVNSIKAQNIIKNLNIPNYVKIPYE